jgi:serine/threonine protein kinase
MFDLGRADETTYITMEFVSGEDLKTLLRRVGLLPAGRTVAIAREVAEGLAEAHRQGVIHRDLKPQNIMIDRGGSAHIMDFGIARSAGGGGITGPGVIIGTPDYMSPEQLEGKDADQRSDIYSFGAVLFEMATGEAPFEGSTPMAVALKHKTEKPRDPGALNPQVPKILGRLILRCLEKDPQKRYQTAESLLADLAAVEGELPTTRRLTGAPVKAVRQRRRRLLKLAAIVLPLGAVVLAAALYFVFLRGREPGGAGFPKPAASAAYKSSIAVLPFEDLSPQKDQEAFSSGITDDLITKLSSLGQLKVISRQSVMRYRSGDKDIREIGRELGVENILEGSIQKEKDNVRVNVKLTRVQDGSNLWGETYDRKVESIFSVQDEISKAVVNALRIELVAGQDYMLVKRYTQNPDAYNLYMQARLDWNTRDEASLERSVELFQQAIAKDPKFALAYAGIADAYNLLSRYSSLSPREAFPKAKEAAEKAVEIDDGLAEGYISRAFVKAWYDWDWMGAEIDFNWAIGLNPNYATAYHWYGNVLLSLGRAEEGLAKLEKAQELDPQSLSIKLAVGYSHYLARRSDRALKIFRETLKADPNFPTTHRVIGLVYLQKKSYRQALKELEKAEKLSGGKGTFLPEIACTQALAGNREAALKIAAQLIERSKTSYVDGARIAFIFASLGDKDKAFEYLDKAYEDRDTGLTAIKVDPLAEPLRDDPRFDALLDKMNLR